MKKSLGSRKWRKDHLPHRGHPQPVYHRRQSRLILAHRYHRTPKTTCISHLAMVDCWVRLSIQPFDHLALTATPVPDVDQCGRAYLFHITFGCGGQCSIVRCDASTGRLGACHGSSGDRVSASLSATLSCTMTTLHRRLPSRPVG